MNESSIIALAIGIFGVLILAYLEPLYDFDLKINKKLGWPKGVERFLDKRSVWCQISRLVLVAVVIACLVALFKPSN